MDKDDVTDNARERQRERSERVEETMEEVDAALDELSYPTNPSEMKAVYGESQDELPNETESLPDVFDRIEDKDYDTPQDAREAVLGELTGRAGAEHGDRSEYNTERELDALEQEESESYGKE